MVKYFLFTGCYGECLPFPRTPEAAVHIHPAGSQASLSVPLPSADTHAVYQRSALLFLCHQYGTRPCWEGAGRAAGLTNSATTQGL